MKIGFSTGSIALHDVRRGLDIAKHGGTEAIELSALREEELDPLLNMLNELDLSSFSHISFHAPSKRVQMSEDDFISKLKKVADRKWAIIVHPDVIEDISKWRSLGKAVCIENMDKRKKIGRTASQLKEIFDELPDARFCFDIGHARQVDPTMQEAETFLQCFRDRLEQVHMSYVNSESRHERLNYESIMAYQRLAHLVDESVPIILETPVDYSEVEEEVESAGKVFRWFTQQDSDSLNSENDSRNKVKILLDENDSQ